MQITVAAKYQSADDLHARNQVGQFLTSAAYNGGKFLNKKLLKSGG